MAHLYTVVSAGDIITHVGESKVEAARSARRLASRSGIGERVVVRAAKVPAVAGEGQVILAYTRETTKAVRLAVYP